MKKTVISEFMQRNNYDQKHIKNLSTKKVPDELLQAIESGCTLETLEQLAKGFPICKYETQLTIHGIFQEPKTGYVGYYKNLFRNKNNSLGVRWSAVDFRKKSTLFNLIVSTNNESNHWHIVQNSQQFYIEKMYCCDNVTEAQKKYDQFKNESEKIDKSLFIGNCGANVLRDIFGRFYVLLIVDLKCFYEKNFIALFESITGCDYHTAVTNKKNQEKEQQRKEKELQQVYEQQRKEKELKRIEQQKQLDEWKKTAPIPEGFKAVETYSPKDGDIISNRIICFGGSFQRLFITFKKCFGRLCCYNCDISGNITGKGSQVYKTNYGNVLVKEA